MPWTRFFFFHSICFTAMHLFVQWTGAFRITPLRVSRQLSRRPAKLGIVNVDVRAGTTRLDSHFGLQEAFAEVKAPTTSARNPISFSGARRESSTRFNSRISGAFFFRSSRRPGVRFFGNLDSNRWQYNLAYFNLLEKNTNSGLNSLRSHESSR